MKRSMVLGALALLLVLGHGAKVAAQEPAKDSKGADTKPARARNRWMPQVPLRRHKHRRRKWC